nr:uncharacterized protein LOC117684166 [Crassostrea gigas]
MSPFDKTLNYLDRLNSPVRPTQPLSPQAPPFTPKPRKTPEVENSTPGIDNQNVNRALIDSTPHHPSIQTRQVDSSSTHPVNSLHDTSNFLIKKNILLESLQQQQFQDRPDRYIVWKTQFRTMVADIKCSPLEEISLLTTSIHNDSDAYRLVMSARTSCASNPQQCLHTIWNRMDERFGSAELVEASLKARLMDLPDFMDRKKLYALHDLLTEVETVKNLSEYSTIFFYLDSSLGVKPIIQKLSKQIQEKWVTRATNYKKQHAVLFPPFAEFVKFIEEMSIIRNDPGLMYEIPKETNLVQKSVNKNRLVYVTTRKTDISAGNSRNSSHLCLIHNGSKHTINECIAFRSRSLENKKAILHNHNLCLKCCETSDHFAARCKSKIYCDICEESDFHCTALHPLEDSQRPRQQPSRTTTPILKHGEESSGSSRLSVNSKCTEICGKPSFHGRSCARIVPVHIYSEGEPGNSITAYALLDDQSNKTLGRSLLFDSLGITTSPVEYSMQPCSGKNVSFGRLARGLIVKGINDSQNVQLKLPSILECDNIPGNHSEIPTPEVALCYPHMRDIAKHLHVLDSSVKILLLIGRDLPEAHHSIDQRIGPLNTPFAQRSRLGWTIIGDVCLSGQHIPSSRHSSHKTFVSENGRPTALEPCDQTVNIRNNFVNTYKTKVTKLNIFETTSDDNKPGLSIEDRKFLNIMDKEFHMNSEGKWTAPLPFRSPREPIPDNYQMALRRAKSLDASLHHNEVKKDHFLAFMQKILDNEHAELAPYQPHGKERWYLPLFGVYHPRKPDQIRGVFDASAKYEGVCLNDQLLQGPDLINDLLGILIRFRKHAVAVVADVQQMFHSFLVEEEHRDYLRFLWHKDNKMENPLVTYRMRVHVFGNRPSPSIAMYGLQRIGELSADTHGPQVKEFIIDDFYVDDGLKSCPTERETIDLICKTQDAMRVHGNLRLHKFASNSQTVMDSFDSQDLAKNLVELDFEKDSPTQRSLGLLWDLKTDTFRFSISDESKPSTRRGILSSVNSLYDPLGFISPVTVSGKIILRKIVASTFDWDELLPTQLAEEWDTWKSSLPVLEKLQIPRVIVPNLNEAVSKELLVYCDASELAIAAVCYVKATYLDGSSSIGFVLGKAKVSPLSGHTIPRLELCAAVLAVEVAQIVVEHLGVKLDTINYFSDSRVVLGYINNETKRFFTYVTNRVARIRSFSKPTQWFYVRSEANPADVGTRGIQPGDMQNSTWILGPRTVCSSADDHVSLEDTTYPLIDPDVDKEVRSNKLEVSTKVTLGLDNGRFSRFSSWKRLILALVCIRRFIQRHRNAKSVSLNRMNDADLFLDTEKLVIKDVQRSVYQEETNCLGSSKPLKKNHRMNDHL